MFSKRLRYSSESPLLASHAMRRGAPGQWQTPTPYRPDQLVHNSNRVCVHPNLYRGAELNRARYMVIKTKAEINKISFRFAFVNTSFSSTFVRSFVFCCRLSSSEQNSTKCRIKEYWFDGDLNSLRTRWQAACLSPEPVRKWMPSYVYV